MTDRMQGEHPYVVVSDEALLTYLSRVSPVSVDWFVAVPSGTRGGKVHAGMRVNPGEVYLDPVVTTTKKPALVGCFDFDVATTSSWGMRPHRVIDDLSVKEEAKRAIRHAFINPCSSKGFCPHCLSPDRFKTFVSSAPRWGEIVFRPAVSGPIPGVIVSPPLVSGFRSFCLLQKPHAILLDADYAKSDDATTSFGVRTTTRHAGKSLFVFTVRPRLYPLNGIQRSGVSLTRGEVGDVLDRVFASLGVA